MTRTRNTTIMRNSFFPVHSIVNFATCSEGESLSAGTACYFVKAFLNVISSRIRRLFSFNCYCFSFASSEMQLLLFQSGRQIILDLMVPRQRVINRDYLHLV